MGPSAERGGPVPLCQISLMNNPWSAVGLRVVMKLPFFSYVFIRGKHKKGLKIFAC